MAVYKYPKFKISIDPDSLKSQGLCVGDIVRRQYVDNAIQVYSLMSVLETGTDPDGSKFFTGALLEGDAPQKGELLDFVRVTNLFDENRSGALYMTATDGDAPYLDVIDGLAKERSLCWPAGEANGNEATLKSQYLPTGSNFITTEYRGNINDERRIFRLTRNEISMPAGIVTGLKQPLCGVLKNPDRVLVSYKVRASRPMDVTASVEYMDGNEIDGLIDVPAGTEWSYVLHVVTIDYSGRYERCFVLDLSDGMAKGEWLEVADLNVVQLSDIANFGNGPKVRIGNVQGVVDPVFGTLEGYGGYMQRLYASNGVNISGTLTAGDENGAGSTFYAGRIHRNLILNSMRCDFGDTAVTLGETEDNPVRFGSVTLFDRGANRCRMRCQTREWLKNHAGERVRLSMFVYSPEVSNMLVIQNEFEIGFLTLTAGWKRYGFTFVLKDIDEDLCIDFKPETVGIKFCAPQLERGDMQTAYQPTDGRLDETDDYGVWFARGGIGGTIQNPLLRLNKDGSMSSQRDEFRIEKDGTGHLANGAIRWTDKMVELGEGVVLGWGNLDEETQENLKGEDAKLVKLSGQDTFVMGDGGYEPGSIFITAGEFGFGSLPSQRQWEYLDGEQFVEIAGAQETYYELWPDGAYWGGQKSLTLRYSVELNHVVYLDTITIKKTTNSELYVVEVKSVTGDRFVNGLGSTVLSASVKYNGILLSEADVEARFELTWKKFKRDGSPDVNWGIQTGRSITVNASDVDEKGVFVVDLNLV